ncbi:MAG TPA: helix-turn-helix domain-containing protein [Methanomassiliicoccaceae archaeon]|nr:helix-turn-helix domain-containing protein [Methanomassiliicoccaceae archaeon]
MMEAELSIGGMEFWMVDAASSLDCTITITDCIPWQKTGGQALFTISSADVELGDAISTIRRCRDVTAVDASQRKNGQIVGSVVMSDCWIIWDILAAGCFLELAWSSGDGKANFKLFAGSEGSFPHIIKAISSRRVELDIIRIVQSEDRPMVSRKQEKLVRLALDKGYYDYPRRVEVRELARLAGMSSSATFEMLKRGEKNIIRHYFERRK